MRVNVGLTQCQGFFSLAKASFQSESSPRLLKLWQWIPRRNLVGLTLKAKKLKKSSILCQISKALFSQSHPNGTTTTYRGRTHQQRGGNFYDSHIKDSLFVNTFPSSIPFPYLDSFKYTLDIPCVSLWINQT